RTLQGTPGWGGVGRALRPWAKSFASLKVRGGHSERRACCVTKQRGSAGRIACGYGCRHTALCVMFFNRSERARILIEAFLGFLCLLANLGGLVPCWAHRQSLRLLTAS